MIARTYFEEPLVAAPKYSGIPSIYKIIWNPEKMQNLIEIVFDSQTYVMCTGSDVFVLLLYPIKLMNSGNALSLHLRLNMPQNFEGLFLCNTLFLLLRNKSLYNKYIDFFVAI